MNIRNLKHNRVGYQFTMSFKPYYNNIRFLYLLAILSSGLFYAYATTRLISTNLATPFLILLLSTLIDIIVFFDLILFKKLSQISSRYLSLITAIFLLILGIFSFEFSNQLFLLVILYTFCTLSFSLHLLAFEQKIVGLKGNEKSGLISITLLRNFSKIIGFSVGALIHSLQLQTYSFILLISFLLFMIVNIQPETITIKLEQKSRIVKGKIHLFLLTLLGTTAVFWIPLFIVELKNNGNLEYSSMVFMSPGIVSVLYLKFLQNKVFNKNFTAKNILYVSLLLLFLLLNMYGIFFIVRVILFSFIVAIGISVSIEVRSEFMRLNKNIGTKISLQIFNLVSAFSLLCFTILAIYFKGIPYFILILNVLASLIILFNREEIVHENRALL